MSNTEYISTSFFSKLEEIHCGPLGASIMFNNGLKQLIFPNLTLITCPFYAYNNTHLDATLFCEKLENKMEMFIYHNLINCKGCVVTTNLDYDRLTPYLNCTELVGPTTITDISIARGTDMSPLSTIVNINGSFEVTRTDLIELSFLKSLKFIKSNHYYANDMNFHENFELKRINISSLESLNVTYGSFILNIEQVHPDFCITTEEMDLFMRSDVRFNNMEAVFCLNETSEHVCEYESMFSLEDNCVGVIGDVVIDSGDELHVEKLKDVNTVYGSLIIQNTKLEDLSFLGNLQYVILLANTSTAFQVMNNKNLQVLNMPKLKRVHSKSKYQISFNENGAGLLNSTTCLQLMKSLVATDVVFDRQECEVIDRTDGSKDNGAMRDHVFKQGIFIFLLSYSYVSLYC